MPTDYTYLYDSPEQKALNDKLFAAVLESKPLAVIKALDEGAYVNARKLPDDPKMYTGELKKPLSTTPLHLATKRGDLSCMRVLINYGANVNKHDAKNQTPLHIAAEKGNADAVEMLLAVNSILTLKDYKHHTAGWLAHKNSHFHIANRIINVMGGAEPRPKPEDVNISIAMRNANTVPIAKAIKLRTEMHKKKSESRIADIIAERTASENRDAGNAL